MRKKRERAFTLIEMLTAAVIATLTAVTAAATLHAVGESRKKIEDNTALRAELRYAQDMIQSDLLNLYRDRELRNMRLTCESQSVSGGAGSRLVMYTVSRGQARPDQPESDVYEVEYFLKEREGRTALMRRVWPGPDPGRESRGVLYPAAENIVGFSVRFYDGSQWCLDWPIEREQMPELVEITLRANNAGAGGACSMTFVASFPRRPGGQGVMGGESP